MNGLFFLFFPFLEGRIGLGGLLPFFPLIRAFKLTGTKEEGFPHFGPLLGRLMVSTEDISRSKSYWEEITLRGENIDGEGS